MTGEELFNQLSNRDYSGSDADQYAQTLQTMFFHFSSTGELEEFFAKLLEAESEGKKLEMSDDESDEYSLDSITLS